MRVGDSDPGKRGPVLDEIVPVNFPRNHIVEFGGRPVVEFAQSGAIRELRWAVADELGHDGIDEGWEQRRAAAVADPASVAWWLEFATETGEDFASVIDVFAAQVDTRQVGALVVGGELQHGSEPHEAAELLCARHDEFPRLRALFLGEIDDNQIHFVDDIDIGPLPAAFAELTEFTVCLTGGMAFGLTAHSALRRLVLHTGALLPDTVTGIARCDLPELSWLELWNGDDFGETQAEEEAEAFEALFGGGSSLPRLTHLGLRNFTFADDMVEQLAGAPLLPRLETLDLSRSAVTDESAPTLASSPGFRGLRRLDLRHTRLTPESIATIATTLGPAGVDVVTGS